jgi:hypothetical protein
MDVVVNDTNIFIDLLSVELLEEAFKLPIDFHTVDYVVSEIVDSYQKECIMSLVDRGLLTVKEFNEIESYEIINMYGKRSNNVSVTDCSVWESNKLFIINRLSVIFYYWYHTVKIFNSFLSPIEGFFYVFVIPTNSVFKLKNPPIFNKIV